jgi:hypothetical protein
VPDDVDAVVEHHFRPPPFDELELALQLGDAPVGALQFGQGHDDPARLLDF